MHLDLMRDPAKKFPAIDRHMEITSMRIWHCKYASLKSLDQFQNVEELIIGSFPDSSLDVLEPLHKLRYLSILHMPKISDLAILTKFENLESLSLSTSPAWDASRKCTVVQSLLPIAKMVSLKHLELFGICPENKSLADLDNCKKLESARFSQYPSDEIERFYQKTGLENHYNPPPLLMKT